MDAALLHEGSALCKLVSCPKIAMGFGKVLYQASTLYRPLICISCTYFSA